MKKLVYLSIALLAAACTPKGATTTTSTTTTTTTTTASANGPSQADVDRMSTKYPGYTLAELTQGKQLYQDNCQTCHNLKSPRSRDEAGWKEIVPDMVKRVNNQPTPSHLDAKAEEAILRYLVTMSSK